MHCKYVLFWFGILKHDLKLLYSLKYFQFLAQNYISAFYQKINAIKAGKGNLHETYKKLNIYKFGLIFFLILSQRTLDMLMFKNFLQKAITQKLRKCNEKEIYIKL